MTEQQRPGAEASALIDSGAEVDEADAAEQARAVGFDDDDYR